MIWYWPSLVACHTAINVQLLIPIFIIFVKKKMYVRGAEVTVKKQP